MQNKTVFVFSLLAIVSLHIYMLRTVSIPKQIVTVKPQKKVSTIINLQRVSIKEPESIVKVVPEPPKPVVEEVVVLPPKVIKKKALRKVVKKVNKTVKRKAVKKKKIVKKKKTKIRKVAKTTSKTHRSAPKQKAIKNAYLAKIRRIIEQHKRYPKGAKRMKQQGTAYIKFSISADGTVHHIGLAKKCPFTKLNKAALKILQNIGKFDAIPTTIGKSHLSLTIPIAYKILN